MPLAQEYLEENYPNQNVKEINIGGNNLLGELNLSNYLQLEELYCGGNGLTNLNLTNNPKLEILKCSYNQLTNLNLGQIPNLTELNCRNNKLTNTNFLITLPHPEKLTKLMIGHNPYSNPTLNFITPFINLEKLGVENSNLTGSLSPLQACNNLSILDIRWNNNLTPDLENLPTDLGALYCYNTPLEQELKKHKKLWERETPEYITLLKRWKKANLPKLLKKELEQKLKFLQQETERLENLKQTLKEQIPFLEKQIELSQFLINEKKERIVKDYLLFTETEEEVLQQLIESHKEYFQGKKEKSTNIINLRQNYDKLYYKLENDNFIKAVESILANFEELYQKEWELEQQKTEKEKSIESQSIIKNQQQEINNLQKEIKELQVQSTIKALEYIDKWQSNLNQNYSSLRIELSLPQNSIFQLPNNIITSLMTKLNNKSDEETINEIKELLTKKQSFITNRQKTINNLRDYIDKLEFLNNKGAIKIIEKGTKFFNIFAEASSGITLGLSKSLVETSKFSIDLSKDKTLKETIKNFKFSFIQEEKFIKDIKEIVNNASKKHNLEVDIKLFGKEYELYEVATEVWKGKKHLTLEEMKSVIKSLTDNLKELQNEVKSEQKEFNKLMSKNEFITQTEHPPKYKY